MHAVIELYGKIFVGQDAFRFPTAPEVYPDTGVAVPGEVAMIDFIAFRGEIALAIGNVLQNRRHGVLFRSLRHPDA